MNSAKFIHRNGRGSRQLNATPVHVAETKSFLTSCSLFLMELQEIGAEQCVKKTWVEIVRSLQRHNY